MSASASQRFPLGRRKESRARLCDIFGISEFSRKINFPSAACHLPGRKVSWEFSRQLLPFDNFAFGASFFLFAKFNQVEIGIQQASRCANTDAIAIAKSLPGRKLKAHYVSWDASSVLLHRRFVYLPQHSGAQNNGQQTNIANTKANNCDNFSEGHRSRG